MNHKLVFMSNCFTFFCLFSTMAETTTPILSIDSSVTNRPDIVQWRTMETKLQTQMPYMKNHYWNHYTLTALCARKWICYGTIMTVTNLGFSYPKEMTGMAEVLSDSYTGEKKRLTVAINECLQGGLQGTFDVIVNYRDTECMYVQKNDWNHLAPRQNYLFFMSDTMTNPSSPVYIIQWEAMLSLENDSGTIITTVKEALPVFQNPWKNTEAYYTLLRKHYQSPLQRIREDASRSLQNFSMFCPSNLLLRILSDPVIYPVQKEYIEEIIVPARIKKLKNLKTDFATQHPKGDK